MPQELPAAAGRQEDAVARFDAAREEFAADLRDLHIRCGKPKQSVLVEAAARSAVAKKNDKFRLHPGTLSVVLRGKKTPTHDFLSALILQLVQARPAVGDYKQVWPQWDLRWQDLMRLKAQADAHRAQHGTDAASTPSSVSAKEQLVKTGAEDGEAARLLADARQEAEAIRAAARAEAAVVLAQAREEASAKAAQIAAQPSTEANRAETAGGQPAAVPRQPVPHTTVHPSLGSSATSAEERWPSLGNRHARLSERVEEDTAGLLDAANGKPNFAVAVYRWDTAGRRGSGVQPAAYSMQEHQAARQGHQLGPLLWASGWSGALPAPSLARVVLADEALVVHRVPTLDRGGRPSTVSYVLAGTPKALTASRALLLECPPKDWMEKVSGTIYPATADRLASEIQRNHPRYLELIPRLRWPLTAATAQLFRSPDRRLSFLPPLSDDAAKWAIEPARLLIWGLCAMLEKVVGDSYFSYATWNTEDSADLRLTCVPQWVASSTQDAALVRISLEHSSDDEALELASRLVHHFLQTPDHPEMLFRHLGLRLNHGPQNPQQGMKTLAAALRVNRRLASAEQQMAAEVQDVALRHVDGAVETTEVMRGTGRVTDEHESPGPAEPLPRSTPSAPSSPEEVLSAAGRYPLYAHASRSASERTRKALANELTTENGGPDFSVAVYRWDVAGPQGAGPPAAAYSMLERQAVALQQNISPLLWLGSENQAQSSVARGTWGAAVHRMPIVDSAGRPSTVLCLLSGTPSALTASRTLLLDGPSPRWLMKASGTIQPWPADRLALEIQRNHVRYLQQLPRVRWSLKAVTAELFRKPQASFSFPTPPSDDAVKQGIDPTRLLIWGLSAMLEKLLGDAYFSYSTLEARETVGLRLTHTPQRQHRPQDDTGLVRIRLRSGVPADEAHDLAHDLVELFLQAPDRPELIYERLKLKIDYGLRTPQQRIEALTSALRRARRV